MSNGQTALRRQPRTRRVVMAILFAVLIVAPAGYLTGQALGG